MNRITTRIFRARRTASLVILISSALVLGADVATATPLLISEVFYDAVGSDDQLSFVELSGTPGASLAGLVLEGINGSGGGVTVTIALSGLVPTDGLFVIGDRNSAGQTLVTEADLLANFDFQNGPDSVVLRDGAIVLDALGYGVFGASLVFAGEGQPAPDPAAGSSLARSFADVDTGDNATDFEVLDVPTPGEAEFVVVAEPSTGTLSLLGLGALAWAGRQRRDLQRM
jgi:hypothetical protein